MKKIIIAHSILIIGLISSVMAKFYPDLSILAWVTFLISMVYLFSGWYIFKAFYPDGHPLMLFIMGYLYSGVFIGAVFSATGWPMSDILIFFSLIWAVAQGVIVWTTRRKIPDKFVIHLEVEACLLIILSVVFLIQ
jgi:hypothetical protein